MRVSLRPQVAEKFVLRYCEMNSRRSHFERVGVEGDFAPDWLTYREGNVRTGGVYNILRRDDILRKRIRWGWSPYGSRRARF